MHKPIRFHLDRSAQPDELRLTRCANDGYVACGLSFTPPIVGGRQTQEWNQYLDNDTPLSNKDNPRGASADCHRLPIHSIDLLSIAITPLSPPDPDQYAEDDIAKNKATHMSHPRHSPSGA